MLSFIADNLTAIVACLGITTALVIFAALCYYLCVALFKEKNVRVAKSMLAFSRLGALWLL